MSTTHAGGGQYGGGGQYAGGGQYPRDDQYAWDEGYNGDDRYSGGDRYDRGDRYAGREQYAGRDQYAGPDQYGRRARREIDPTKVGGVMLMVAAAVSTVLVIAGLFYWTGATARSKAALAAGQCEPLPGPNPTGLLDTDPHNVPEADQCTTMFMLTKRYEAIATPFNQQINSAVKTYTASEGSNFVAADSAVRTALAAEDAFSKSLTGLLLPPASAAQGKTLIRATSALAKLTAEQAHSSSLAQLRSFNSRIDTASAAVRTDMRLLTKALAIPPTANEEP